MKEKTIVFTDFGTQKSYFLMDPEKFNFSLKVEQEQVLKPKRKTCGS